MLFRSTTSERSPVVVGTGSAIAIVISLLIAWLIGRGIANPVRRLNETMMRVVDGHTAVDIEGLTWCDEVGAMARAVAVFRDNAVEKQSRKTKGARDWFDRLRRVNPMLFAHWQLCHGNGRTSGAV